ncbi:hypothetical protein MJO28_010797 [Puccinia striiformis f. sp. tritici]|uniref:Uncharacterized protein n=1 Tax=Puccinia striiformis f. sp. tritici TaxID=168172 RepID=A0ACC0E642_9BASI|nr:hypothetical protein MJO28_010797 [Puccinia striiformis f. sp. tritici]
MYSLKRPGVLPQRPGLGCWKEYLLPQTTGSTPSTTGSWSLEGVLTPSNNREYSLKQPGVLPQTTGSTPSNNREYSLKQPGVLPQRPGLGRWREYSLNDWCTPSNDGSDQSLREYSRSFEGGCVLSQRPRPGLRRGVPAHPQRGVQPREPTIEDLEDSPETTPQNQDKGKQPEQTGYGLHNARDMDEDSLPINQQQAPRRQGIPHQAPVYHFQDPTYEDIPRIIKEHGLAYDGTHFMKFLD